MNRAAELARKCFAVAKSTSHEGERAAAINRGMALLERAGLDPDDFDIPGRAKKLRGRVHVTIAPDDLERLHKATGEASAAMSRFAAAMRGAHISPGSFDMDDLVREAVAESLRRRRERAMRGE